jgi:hypothetical protein
MRFIFSALSLFLLLIASRADVSAGQTKPIVFLESNREEAERLWEQAIAAKGGRERLYSINNLQFSVRDKAWWNLKRVPNDMEALYVFPGKSWEWTDRTGTIFGFDIWMQNDEKNIHLAYSDCGKGKDVSVSQIFHSPTYRRGLTMMIIMQLNFLMETRWVKPIPVSVERGKVGRHAVDIVRTILKGNGGVEERVSFALDRESHLPRQVIYHTITFGKEYTGAVPLSDYSEVNGIQMPSKVYGKRWVFQLNVDYNERVFEQPPSREAGIEAWKK